MGRLIMRGIAHMLVSALLLTVSSFMIPGSAAKQEMTETSSFENDLEGWVAKATDVWGVTPEAWSITRSQDTARDGNTSLKFFLDNSNDAEKIWVEKSFAVEPNRIYDVTVEYALASVSSELGAGTAFTIITGVLKSSPATREELSPAYKDAATNGTDESGYRWLEKRYEFTVQPDEQATLYVVIGIWGDWEVRRTFYFDDVRITISKKPEESQFYSFEDDLQGWTSNATDLDSGSGSIERVEQYALGGEDGKYSINFDLNSVNENGKVWIEKPFMVEPGRKYKVGLDYAFHSTDCTIEPRFRIISGVFRRSPETGEDLTAAVQEKTTSCTWGWLHKSYDFTIKSKKSDTLYLVIGLWGTQKGHRTYNVDSVCVTITPK